MYLWPLKVVGFHKLYSIGLTLWWVFSYLDPVPPPLPPRRLKSSRPTSLPPPPPPSIPSPLGPPPLPPPPVLPRGKDSSAPSAFSFFPPHSLSTTSTVSKQEGGITPQANVNVVSLNVGELVDTSQGLRTLSPSPSSSLYLCHFLFTFPHLPPAADLKKLQIPVVCGKCNAALSRVSLVKRNVSSAKTLFLVSVRVLL